MQYQAIILGLLEDRPQMYEQLRRERQLLRAVKLYAKELKTSHEACQHQLQLVKPGSDPMQIESEALEIALQEFQDRLPPALANESETLSLDGAMAYLLRHTSRG